METALEAKFSQNEDLKKCCWQLEMYTGNSNFLCAHFCSYVPDLYASGRTVIFTLTIYCVFIIIIVAVYQPQL